VTIPNLRISTSGLTKSGTGVLVLSGPVVGAGPLTIHNGSISVTNTIANFGDVTGVLLNGGRLLFGATPTGPVTLPIQIGEATGIFDVASGVSLTVASTIADAPGATGALVNISAGTLILTGNNTYTGRTVISGGAISISQDNNLGSPAAAGIVAIPGSTVTTNGLIVTGSFSTNRQMILTGGTGAANINVTAGNTLTWNGPIDHIGTPINAFALQKLGTGTLVIGNTNNSFNGILTVAAGSLNVNGVIGPANNVGPGTAAENFGVVVASGASLGGTGTISRAIQITSGATLSPGNSVGTLTAHAVTLAGGSTWLNEWATALPRTGGVPANINTNDRLILNNSLILGSGNISINVDGTGLNFTLGQVYDYYVATVPALTGTLSQFIVTPQNFNIGGSFNTQWIGTDLVVSFTPIPEPGTTGFIGLAGLVGLTLRKRRRRAKTAA
jgi:fibronectin-binding autotransporter adhesin